MSFAEALETARVLEAADADPARTNAVYAADEDGFCEKRGWKNHFAETRIQAYNAIQAKKSKGSNNSWLWFASEDVREECELERLATLLTIASRIAFLAEGTDSMQELVVPVTAAKDGIVRHHEYAYGLLCRQLWNIETLLIHRRIELEERRGKDCVTTVVVSKDQAERDAAELKLAQERVEQEIASRKTEAAAAAKSNDGDDGGCVCS